MHIQDHLSNVSDSQILKHLRNRLKEHTLQMELKTWYVPILQHILIFENYLFKDVSCFQ